MLDRVIEAIEPTFSEWGLLIVLVATFLESGIVVASIVPGESVLLMAGFFTSTQAGGTSQPPLELPEVVAVAFAGALLGDVFGYVVGRTAGNAIVRKVGRFIFLPERRLPLLERYFLRYGTRAVILGRFAPFLRSVRTLVAGTAKMPVLRFLAADVVAAAAWATGIVLAGFALGESWRVANRYLGAASAVVFVLLVVAFLLTWRSVKRRFERELSEDDSRADRTPRGRRGDERDEAL